jgi:asparagine synthase (glutamine-hydrolysing)
MGFSIPLDRWFRGPLRKQVRSAIMSAPLLDAGILNQDYLGRIVSEHESGMHNHGAVLWSLLMFRGFFADRASMADEPSSLRGAALAQSGT